MNGVCEDFYSRLNAIIQCYDGKAKRHVIEKKITFDEAVSDGKAITLTTYRHILVRLYALIMDFAKPDQLGFAFVSPTIANYNHCRQGMV